MSVVDATSFASLFSESHQGVLVPVDVALKEDST